MKPVSPSKLTENATKLTENITWGIHNFTVRRRKLKILIRVGNKNIYDEKKEIINDRYGNKF